MAECSRCHRDLGPHDPTAEVTAGYYVVTGNYWARFANPGEQFLCDACMWSDPAYRAERADAAQPAKEDGLGQRHEVASVRAGDPQRTGGSMSQYPQEITPEILDKFAHITDQQVRDDIYDTEREIDTLRARTQNVTDKMPQSLFAEFVAREEFVAFLRRLLTARAAARYV